MKSSDESPCPVCDEVNEVVFVVSFLLCIVFLIGAIWGLDIRWLWTSLIIFVISYVFRKVD